METYVSYKNSHQKSFKTKTAKIWFLKNFNKKNNNQSPLVERG